MNDASELQRQRMNKDEGRPEDDPEFEILLDYLHRSRGFDFTGYKRPSLMRRINKRMFEMGIQGYSNYVDYMEVHPEEFRALFDTILINVTAFFRDASAWELLSQEVLPRILAGKPEGGSIRVWCAGCASGEEAYSLAMVLAEALGVEAFRDRVKVYATDVDEEALTKARQAIYDAKELQNVPSHLIEKYFEVFNHRYIFHKELRRSVIFGRHDLIQDAPISRVDLLTCRNTLMYFNTETQVRILDRFHFALNEGGVLFLGKSETLLTYSNNSFAPIDLKRRFFARTSRGDQRDRLVALPRLGGEEPVNHFVSHIRLRDAAFESGVAAQLLVDSSGLLILGNERARAIFNLMPSDLGRPLKDLQISYRPADLRSCIDRAFADRRAVVLNDVEWTANDNAVSYLNIYVVPLGDPGGNLVGSSITFVDVTANHRLQDELQNSNRELAAAYEELQSANEELETTNEELQSTNEELETTNEELQSTNEELETMNEELQSTNEEVEAVNEEHRLRGEELNRLNAFLGSILGSLRDGVVVVDKDLLVRAWNNRAEDLWGVRADEVQGKNFMNLDIGLPLDELRHSIRACLSGEIPYQELMLDATNRRGRAIKCRVICTPMTSRDAITGVILVMEENNVAQPSRSAKSDDGPGGAS